MVVTAAPTTDVDAAAAEHLGGLLDELEGRSLTLAFAKMKDPVKQRLRTCGLFERVGEERFLATLGTAVDGYLTTTGTDWVDWEEQRQEDVADAS